MVSIGGMSFNMPSGVISNVLKWGFWSIMILVGIGLIIFFTYRHFRNKVSFTDDVTLTKIFDNGSEKTYYGLKGGKYVGKQGAWEYRIKIPKQAKKKDLGYMPDFSQADADGSLHFVTCGDGSHWQQATQRTVVKEVREIKDTITGEVTQSYVYELLKKPIVSSDEKNIMIKDIKNWREVVNKNKVTAFAIGLGMFLIMVIAHLISLYIQTKVKCPTV
jgi:hypothetical protein